MVLTSLLPCCPRVQVVVVFLVFVIVVFVIADVIADRSGNDTLANHRSEGDAIRVTNHTQDIM